MRYRLPTSIDMEELTDEELFTLLEELQNTTTALFSESWRRGIQVEMATKAMEMQNQKAPGI